MYNRRMGGADSAFCEKSKCRPTKPFLCGVLSILWRALKPGMHHPCPFCSTKLFDSILAPHIGDYLSPQPFEIAMRRNALSDEQAHSLDLICPLCGWHLEYRPFLGFETPIVDSGWVAVLAEYDINSRLPCPSPNLVHILSEEFPTSTTFTGDASSSWLLTSFALTVCTYC